MASFLYPSTIKILRQVRDDAPGAQSYGGVSGTKNTVIASGIAANIQADRQGTTPIAKIPGDAAGQSIWKIIFKASNGVAQSRDFIVDDIGRTYQVISADWGPLVTTCRCQIMET